MNEQHEYVALARAAAESVLIENDMVPPTVSQDDPISALAWAMGDPIDYEDALVAIVAAAINIDRAQRENEEN